MVGTRESRTAGSAHVLRPRDLERMDYDNPETGRRSRCRGVYARGEDGFGLRPNIGIRGTYPDRSKKVTLMEDGILFGPAPYSAPAAYLLSAHHPDGAGARDQGPGRGQLRPADRRRRDRSRDARHPRRRKRRRSTSRPATYGYGKVHGYYGASTARSGYVLEGVHLRSTGFKELDGGGDTGFEKNEWMWKGRYLLSTDPNAVQNVGLKLGYADEDSRESYLGLTDADLRANPNRRYRASRFDRMQWHRTQIAATYHGALRDAFTIDAAVYRNDFSRDLAQGQPHRPAAVRSSRGARQSRLGRERRCLQRADRRSERLDRGARRDDLHRPEPARVRLAGRAGRRRLAGATGPGRAPGRGRRALPLRPHRSPAHRRRLPDARRQPGAERRRRPITTANGARLGARAGAARDRRRDWGPADGDAGRARRADRHAGCAIGWRAPRSRGRRSGW